MTNNNTMKHPGVVECIRGEWLTVKIIQTSACAACSAKGHCTSADSKEQLIEVRDAGAASYKVGDRVVLVAHTSMGMQAVVVAFVLPFLLMMVTLFVAMAYLEREAPAALLALGMLVPYYVGVWLCRDKLKRTFAFKLNN